MPKQSYRAEEQVRWAFLCLEAIAKGPSKEIRHFTFLEATYKSFSLDHLFLIVFVILHVLHQCKFIVTSETIQHQDVCICVSVSLLL